MSSLSAGERVLVDVRPHVGSVLLRALPLILAVLLVRVASTVLGQVGLVDVPMELDWVLMCVVAARLVWEEVTRRCRRYILTDRRVVRRAGVLRRSEIELPLAKLQSVELFKTLAERLVGLGTIGFATAGTSRVEAYWIMVERPEEHLAKVREAMQAAGERRGAEGVA